MYLSRPRAAESSASSHASATGPSDEILASIAPAEWAYIAEGGANVIFRYVGSVASLAGWVLRVRKQGVRGAHPKEIVEFAERITPQGSRDAYVQVARAAAVSVEFLLGLNALLLADFASEQRPPHRRETSLDTSLTWVLLLPDVAFTDASLCIEIKPKSGILPTTPHVHPIKQSVCRFCMHQHLKQAQGTLAESSAYCPLDLFSNDKARIARALTALTVTPQNNLRVFSAAPTDPAASPDHIDLLAELLHSHVGLLDDLRAMHAKDSLDVEGMAVLAQLHDALDQASATTSTSATSAADTSQPLRGILPTLSSALRRQLDNHMAHAMSVKCDFLREDWTSLSVRDFCALYRTLLDDFLVATTFKDCSVLLSVRPTTALAPSTPTDAVNGDPQTALAPPSAQHSIVWNGQSYRVVVAIVDLDIKSHKPVAAYYKLDQAIVEHYASTRVDQPSCSHSK